MNKLVIITLIIFLTSCTQKIDVLENINIDKEEITIISNDKLYEDVTKNVENKKVNQKIVWDKNIKFSYCDILSKYENISEFMKTDKNIEEISELLFNRNPRYTKGVIEYCRTIDHKNYIVVYEKYGTQSIYKYNTDTKNIQKAELKGFFSKRYIKSPGIIKGRSYGDTSLEVFLDKYIDNKKDITGFGIKNKDIIPFTNYGVSITGHQESAPGMFADKYQFFSKKTRDYCQSGLSSEGKLSVCFADIFYDFDLVKNEIKESRVCTYYIDDNGKIKTLEKCFDFNENYKGYNFKYKVKGMDIYQDESGKLSILNIDLNSAKIDFAGVNTQYEKKEERYYRTIIKTDLEYENENSELYRFNRFNANEFHKTFPREYYIKNNTHAVINGQFFDQTKNPTFLSFPLKSGGKIINSHVNNKISKRTFVIDTNGNAKILEGYKKEYLNNDNYKELIVAFNPEVKAQENSKIGRTYIGINNSKNIVFFVAKDKTQEEMNKIISDYGIQRKNIIMMDGGASSQFAFYDNKGPGSIWEQFYGEWKVPHYFIIYTD